MIETIKKKREKILNRICNITVELSDLHYQNQYSTVDVGGNKRRNLTEEWILLHKELDVLKIDEFFNKLKGVPNGVN